MFKKHTVMLQRNKDDISFEEKLSALKQYLSKQKSEIKNIPKKGNEIDIFNYNSINSTECEKFIQNISG